ncbi:protein angel homolog 2 isoform X1 [Pieris rapae]|uniref:protein angel homolog 2 isoform X1 n=1 Tax=Pieris rapae TaxID=64459 RepID=UPI001E27B3D8|nr:protein angel homolog 2 isoform X1 [Pieris rapae]
MLKLTQRFWKHTNFACNLHNNRINFKNYHLLTLRSRYHVLNSQLLKNPFIIHCSWGRLLASITKDSRYFQRSDIKEDKMADGIGEVPIWTPYQSDDVILISSSSSSCSDDLDDYGQKHEYQCWESDNVTAGFSDSFRVLSYNVLAQNLLECHPYLYKDCTPTNLIWEERFLKIFNQIINANPDIICLQEVEEARLTDFTSKLETIGFKTFFKKKKIKQDGCAIFFRSSKFEMIDNLTVEFHQPNLPILNRDNVACLAKLKLRDKPDSMPIVVVTTHLLYNPRRMDVRLAQIRLLLAEIDRFAYYNTGRNRGHWPIVLTGDFNSQPNSQVVQLIREGYLSDPIVNDDHSDWRNINVTNNCEHLSLFMNRLSENLTSDFSITLIHNSDYGESNISEDDMNSKRVQFEEMFTGMTLRHSLKFSSVYDHVKKNGKKEGTTFQNSWVTVDYIFFSNLLKLEERLRLPSVSEAKKMGPLPNDYCGSDHIPLAAMFTLRNVSMPS